MKDDLANEDLAHLRALTEPKDDMLKRETPLPKASPVCPVCGLDRPHGHGQAELVSIIRESKNYATTLAVSMHRQHYAEAAPNWQPLPDLVGLLTQIDTMYARLQADLAAAQAERDTALTDKHDRTAEREDMANVGEALMETIKRNLSPDWSWNDCPSEVVVDLINERDQARADHGADGAVWREKLEKAEAEALALRGVVQVGINVMVEPMTARQATWVINARIAINDIPPDAAIEARAK